MQQWPHGDSLEADAATLSMLCISSEHSLSTLGLPSLHKARHVRDEHNACFACCNGFVRSGLRGAEQESRSTTMPAMIAYSFVCA